MVEDLAGLLEPCLSENFLSATWGKSFRHVRGWPGKFARLLPWDDLNEILTSHRLDYPRLRLMQDGKSLPTASYIRYVSSSARKASIPRLLPVELTNQLRSGATLVLDSVDELQQPIRKLAEGLERRFHEHVQVNCYAGWLVSRGFDLHWDDHDVFIVQVTGRKRWDIYGMTTPYPLRGDNEPIPKPTHESVWSDVLEDGDLLYIPRGWWHVAAPLDEPTLHLTVGIHNRTGINMLQWFNNKLRASKVFRQDLPRFGSPTERREHLENLRLELLSKWNEDLLNDYLCELDMMAEPRAGFGLPWSATSDVFPPSGDTLVRLNTSRPLDLQSNAEMVEFVCNKKRWKFAIAALILLRPLFEQRTCSVSELCDIAKGELDETVVRVFLRELLVHGLVVIVTRRR